MIKVGSDFSGVGAFNQALMRLNIPYKEVYACDMDKYARQTYIANYGEPEYYPLNVYDREIPIDPLDIYMTSPPCQAFSLAGKRKGESDKRGILFYNSHEFIQKNKPRYFIFENVKGLLSDDAGKTFMRWVDLLGGKSVNGTPILFPNDESVPYHIYYKVLNAKSYNIPQNRERIFIIGVRDDSDNIFTWPKELELKERLKDRLESDVAEKYYLSEDLLNWIKKHREKRQSSGKFPFTDNDISGCITSRYHKCGAEDIYYSNINLELLYSDDNNSQGNRVYSIDGLSCTLKSESGGTGGKTGLYEIENRIRRLTPRECFRLMDFPESFNWEVSDTQAYRQAGNSICVGVLVAIISKLKL